MTRKFFIAAILTTFISTGCAFAADIDLGEGYHVPRNFASVLITSSDGTAIQNAVNYIQDGGTISLEGEFKLNRTINIKKNLTIRGLNNAVLDRSEASKKDRVIRCQGNITLENLTITGGYSTNGGGVKLDGGDVKIISCDIHGNESVMGGGGIHSQAKTLTLTSCDISDNTLMGLGGGISFIGGTITMTDCNITNNKAQYLQGGGFAAAGSTITMTNCKITGNESGNKGGGFALLGTTKLTAISCDILDNTAPQNPEYYLEDTATYINEDEEETSNE